MPNKNAPIPAKCHLYLYKKALHVLSSFFLSSPSDSGDAGDTGCALLSHNFLLLVLPVSLLNNTKKGPVAEY